TSEDQEEEPEKKEIKKEAGTTSETVKEKVVKEKVVAEKAEVVVAEKAEAVVAEKAKKNDKKRKSSRVKIDEGRSKMRHDKKSKEDESSTESDDIPLAQKLKQKTSKAYTKEMHKNFST
ncbi:hypothetical protein A2U01_0057351, partial [Trifolium medium]|nr:hypothetical protein [Trifolium medium]